MESSSISKTLRLAVEHHEAGRLREAESMYQKILQNDPEHPDALHLLGVVAHQVGKDERAVDLISKALAIEPNLSDAYNNIGNAFRNLNKLNEAVASYQKALILNPNFTKAHNNLGNALHDLGQIKEAMVSYRKALSLMPQYAEAQYNLGVVLQETDALTEAVANYKKALAINPEFTPAHMNLANVLVKIGRHEEAFSSYQDALNFAPNSAEIHTNLGNALRQLDRFDESISSYRTALNFEPDFAETHYNLGIALQQSGNVKDAVSSYQNAIRIKPDLLEAHKALGIALWKFNKLEAAVTSFGQALALDPGDAQTHNNLGLVFQGQGKLDQSVISYNNALEISPDLAEAHNNLGLLLQEACRLDDAVMHYRKALAINPDYATAHSNLLLAEQYRPQQDAQTLYRLHRKWEENHGNLYHASWPKHANTPLPDRRLRVGFVSADLRRHPVGYFLVGVVENLPKDKIQTLIYCDNLSDDLTEEIRASSDEWRYIGGLSDQSLAATIFNDKIDILIDLAGHSANNRLSVFSRKPAPLQITWAGYTGTTGLSAIDYLISDQYSIPAEEEKYYTETIVRMPNGWLCYKPPEYAPKVDISPFKKEGFITFGSFSNPAKLNAEVISAWANILEGVPDSHLLLKYKSVDSQMNRHRLTNMFGAKGIGRNRFTLEGQSSHRELLQRYNDVDIALDPFPYSGGLTTCEALWMGVPVITVAGKTFASRHSLSHLNSLELQELVAHDTNRYILLATELAHQPKKLAKLRAQQREKMAKSTICDVRKFSKDLSGIVRTLWRDWCKTKNS